MIGIKFCIPTAWNNYLFQILRGIESEDYLWKIYRSKTLVKAMVI